MVLSMDDPPTFPAPADLPATLNAPLMDGKRNLGPSYDLASDPVAHQVVKFIPAQ